MAEEALVGAGAGRGGGLGADGRRGDRGRGRPAATPGRLARCLGPGLHPHDAAGPARDVEGLLPGRGARPVEHPRGGPDPARRESLRRDADRGHVRVRPGVLRPLRPAAALPPARARPRLQAPRRAREPVSLRHRAGVAGEHDARARARRGAARLPRRRPRDLPAELGVRQDRLRRAPRLREARDRARLPDRAGGGDRRTGDRAVPRAGARHRAPSEAGPAAPREGLPGPGRAAVRADDHGPAGPGAAPGQDRRSACCRRST